MCMDKMVDLSFNIMCILLQTRLECEDESIGKTIFQMLGGAKAFEFTINHNCKPCANCLTFFHAMRR